MSDLKQRLQDYAENLERSTLKPPPKVIADALERIKALEAGLKPFAEAAPYFEPEEQEGQVLDDDHMIADVITCGELRHAASLVGAKK